MKRKEFLQAKVICLNTNEIFNEFREASEKYGVSHPNRILSAAESKKLLPSGVHPLRKVKLYWATSENYKEKKRIFDESDKLSILASRAVICLNTKEVFESAPMAVNHFKLITVYNLLKACKVNYLSHGKSPITGESLYWAFLDDYESGNFKMPRLLELANEPRKLICLNTKEIFENIEEARKFIGYKHYLAIDKSCNSFDYAAGVDKLTKEKLYWAYLDDFESGKKREFPKLRKKLRKASCINDNSENGKAAVICLNNKKRFKDVNAAARYCGIIRAATITGSCNSLNRSAGKHPRTGEKLYWAKLSDYENSVKTKYPGNGIEMPRRKMNELSKRISVICLNTEEVFKNVYDAAEKFGIEDPNGIVNSCNSEWLSCGENPETEEKLYWAKYTDFKSGMKKKYPGKGLPQEFNKVNVGVRCITTGERFESVLTGARYYGICPAIQVTDACKNPQLTAGIHPVTKNPLYWEYINEEKNV